MPDKPLQDKSVLMVIASDNFRDEEYMQPRSVLEEAGAEITVASSSTRKSTGMLGKVSVTPDVALDEVDTPRYDAVIFVGGSGADEYWDDATAHRVASTAYENDRVLGAICIAPITLGRASLLDGKRATVFNSEVENLKKSGAVYTGAAVERDGNLITADGPQSAEEFGRMVMEAMVED